MSTKKTAPKVETDYTTEDFIVELAQQIDGFTKPDGSKEFPAKSCKDLKMSFPDVKDGVYWMDPNSANSVDAFQVECKFSGSTTETCIKASDPVLSESDDGSLTWHNFDYPASSVQLQLLRIDHVNAKQNFTLQCNKLADLKVRTDDDMELTPGRRSMLKVVYDDECLKHPTASWSRGVLEINTPLKSRLPIADIGIAVDEDDYLLEMGPICFS
jgi:hypothetical protein